MATIRVSRRSRFLSWTQNENKLWPSFYVWPGKWWDTIYCFLCLGQNLKVFVMISLTLSLSWLGVIGVLICILCVVRGIIGVVVIHLLKPHTGICYVSYCKLSPLFSFAEHKWIRFTILSKPRMSITRYATSRPRSTAPPRLLAHVLTRTTRRVCSASNFLHNVKNTRALICLSPSDVTLRRDWVHPGLHNWPFGNWSVATNPCSIHLWSK